MFSFDAIIYSSMGLGILLLGSWVPDDRVNVYGLPIDLIVMISATLVATTGTIRWVTLRSVALIQVPILLLGVSIFWSSDPELGADKFTTLVVSGNIAFILFNTVIEKHGADELAKLLAIYLAILLLIAIPYKAAFGFFNRQVNFFINGPIIFARLMSIAALLSLFFLDGKKRVVSVILFCLAIVWTESKGPILAITVTFGCIALLYASPSTRKKVFWYVAAAVLLVISVVNYVGLTLDDLGRLGSLFALLSGDLSEIDESANTGSLGSRFEMWSKTIDLIPNVPFGLGLGAWDAAVDTRLPSAYPHNLFLELWAEGGLLLGSFAVIPFCVFLFAKRHVFWFVSLCLFVAQMTSGDIGDARFLLVFGLLACFSRQSASAASVDTQSESMTPRMLSAASKS